MSWIIAINLITISVNIAAIIIWIFAIRKLKQARKVIEESTAGIEKAGRGLLPPQPYADALLEKMRRAGSGEAN